MNVITIEFAHNGYVLTTMTDDNAKAEVFVSTAKLNKAIRGLVDELSLVPKKSGEAEAE